MSFFDGTEFFITLFFICIPAVILGILEKNLKLYRMLASTFMIFLIFANDKRALAFLIVYLAFEAVLTQLYLKSRLKEKKFHLYRMTVILSLTPLILCKFSEILNISAFQFLGISYLTFKALQIIIEIYDGIIKEVDLLDYFDFMICFATLSSGPIDRSRRYLQDSERVISRNEYLELLGAGLQKIVIGAAYKFALSVWLFQYVQECANQYAPLKIFEYSYLYGFYMFFDFAGYSLMAIGTSYILGIKAPENFNKPFISIDIKDFWNRWHMSLSFWFRDFLFSRIMMVVLKEKWFSSRLTGASFAFIVNMLVMGLWHGLSASYVLYGLYHGVLLAVTEIYQKKSRFYKNNKKKKWYMALSWLLTINVVMFGFLIFSGEFTNIILIIIQKITGGV